MFFFYVGFLQRIYHVHRTDTFLYNLPKKRIFFLRNSASVSNQKSYRFSTIRWFDHIFVDTTIYKKKIDITILLSFISLIKCTIKNSWKIVWFFCCCLFIEPLLHQQFNFCISGWEVGFVFLYPFLSLSLGMLEKGVWLGSKMDKQTIKLYAFFIEKFKLGIRINIYLLFFLKKNQ